MTVQEADRLKEAMRLAGLRRRAEHALEAIAANPGDEVRLDLLNREGAWLPLTLPRFMLVEHLRSFVLWVDAELKHMRREERNERC